MNREPPKAGTPLPEPHAPLLLLLGMQAQPLPLPLGPVWLPAALLTPARAATLSARPCAAACDGAWHK